MKCITVTLDRSREDEKILHSNLPKLRQKCENQIFRENSKYKKFRNVVLEQGCTTRTSWWPRNFFVVMLKGQNLHTITFLQYFSGISQLNKQNCGLCRLDKKPFAGHIWHARRILCTPVLEDYILLANSGGSSTLFQHIIFNFNDKNSLNQCNCHKRCNGAFASLNTKLRAL